MEVVSCLYQRRGSRNRSFRRSPGAGNRQQVCEGIYKTAFDLKQGSPEVKTPVRREQAIPSMNIIQNGGAEMEASGPSVSAWLSDLPQGALGDIKHAKAKSPFVEALSGMHLSSVEKNDFSWRRAINRSSILELFDSGINQTDCELVVPMRCERMIKVASMKNLYTSGNVDGRKPGEFLPGQLFYGSLL